MIPFTEANRRFLDQFPWINSAFDSKQKCNYEYFLVQICHFVARHRLDIGAKEGYEGKLAPENNYAVFIQGTATPIHDPVEILLELALSQF